MLTLLLFSQLAYAGCTSDADCKGDRVCESGVCVTPAPRATCGRDTDCPGDQVCDAGVCAAPVTGTSSSASTPARSATRSAPRREEMRYTSVATVRIGDRSMDFARAATYFDAGSSAATLARRSVGQRGAGRIALWSGMVVATGGAIYAMTCNPSYVTYNCYSNAGAGIPIAVVGAAGGIAGGLLFRGAAVRSERSAVDAYNEELAMQINYLQPALAWSGRF